MTGFFVKCVLANAARSEVIIGCKGCLATGPVADTGRLTLEKATNIANRLATKAVFSLVTVVPT